MSSTVYRPAHVKFRRESAGGIVYDHENYGYEDASLHVVSEDVIDVLEFVGEGRPRTKVESAFSEAVVETLLERGVLRAE
ncbi:mycofactocin biosynthesis chaperone MftB2 [Natrialbaceae archaeon A-gly3]